MGTEKSKGTMPLQLAGCVKQGGLIEVPFGVTLEAAIYDFGGGLPKGLDVQGGQVGGPLGSIFPEKLLKTPICFDEFAKAGGILGHGGIVVFDQDTDMVELSRHFMEFTAESRAASAPPCRVGSTRAREILEQIRDGKGRPEDLENAEGPERHDEDDEPLRAGRVGAGSRCSRRCSASRRIRAQARTPLEWTPGMGNVTVHHRRPEG